MAIIRDPYEMIRPRMYFIDGPCEGVIKPCEDSGPRGERISVYKGLPIQRGRINPNDRIGPPNVIITNYFRVHVEAGTYFYSVTNGLNHHKVHLIEIYFRRETREENSRRGPRTATDIIAERDRAMHRIEQAMRAGIDEAIIRGMIEAVMVTGEGLMTIGNMSRPPDISRVRSFHPGDSWTIDPETVERVRRACSEEGERVEPVTKPPPIQAPDCSFCPAKKLQNFYGPGSRGNVACPKCFEERKHLKLAKEVDGQKKAP